ncbi:MAG: capsular biosynthesis protein [Pseudomonadota bacterium]
MTGTAAERSEAKRTVLLLQGPFSWFFTYLARALTRRGAEAQRILICPGDWLFWRGANAVAYRGRQKDWPVWIAAYLRNHDVTDIVCLGDGRKWHSDAIAAAAEAGARVHLVEQGYIRPGYLTLEPDGTGGRTRFPNDWTGIEALAAGRAQPAPQWFATSFFGYAAMDVAFNLANVGTSWLFFPHYKQHAIDHPTREWSGWIVNKILPLRHRRRQLAEAEAALAAHRGPFYILPLQLETDYQIRLHAPPGGVRGMLDRTIASFAAHAPSDAALVVKIHPLDHGWTNWRAMAKTAAAQAGVGDRVIFFDGGDLDAMLARCAGVVVANSTVGLTALQARAPVIAVGKAIYDLPGLTHQGDLDGFWAGASPPDAARVETFLTALGAIQTPGGFDGEGATVGAENVADMIFSLPPY